MTRRCRVPGPRLWWPWEPEQPTSSQLLLHLQDLLQELLHLEDAAEEGEAEAEEAEAEVEPSRSSVYYIINVSGFVLHNI